MPYHTIPYHTTSIESEEDCQSTTGTTTVTVTERSSK